VKNEEELRRVGNTYDFVYPKAHPPKVGANLRYVSPVRRISKMKGPIS